MAADTDRARDALQSIPPDLPRDEWVRAGMAFHAAGGETLTPSTNGALRLATTASATPATPGAVSSRGRV